MYLNPNLISFDKLGAWEVYSISLSSELRQCAEEGRDVAQYADVVKAVEALPLGAAREELAHALHAALTGAPMRPDYPYFEPDELDAIRAARPAVRPQPRALPNGEALRDKVRGAWLGRICGCLLGKPVEGWMSGEIRALAQAQGNWPLCRYLKRDAQALERLGRQSAIGNAWADALGGAAPADDDTNYTALAALKLLPRHGRGFTSDDVAREWIAGQPKDAYCTAERRAFCNFIAGIMPPLSATYKNPDREFIGAQIRADYYGYINPGDTEQAADMAWRDARISHVKNGIYGEMFAAAMLARAAASDDMEDIILAGLAEIPERSRLGEAIRGALEQWRSGLSAGECFRRLHSTYDEHNGFDWVHTIPNAVIVALCLLFSGGDYSRGITLAVMQGFDTDCNGATVGSIIGMAHGSAAIDARWAEPVNGRLRTQIFGCDIISIDELVTLTLSHLPARAR